MTLVTDYLLGILCAVLAFRIRQHGREANRDHWATALAASGVAAFLGGTLHGFLPWFSDSPAALLWKATLLSIGIASFSATVATAREHIGPPWRHPVRAVAGLKLACYAAFVLVTDTFLVAILDYSVAFLFIAGVHGRAWFRYRDSGARWVVAAVAVSFVAAGIQAAGIAPHQHFNHNDLYHVVQMVGMWLLYKGASRSAGPRRP